jgi:hypothetical protein
MVAALSTVTVFAVFAAILGLQAGRMLRQMEKPGLPWGDPTKFVVVQARAESRGLFLASLGLSASSVTRGPLVVQPSERGLVFWNWWTTPPTRLAVVPWRAFGGLEPTTVSIRGLAFPAVAVTIGGVSLAATISRRRPDGRLRMLGSDEVRRLSADWIAERDSRTTPG